MYKLKTELYNLIVKQVTVSDARGRLSEVVDTVQTEPVMLERHGKPAAVVISPELFEQLLDAAEELEDIASYEAAMAEPSPNIPWEQVKADLGLT